MATFVQLSEDDQAYTLIQLLADFSTGAEAAKVGETLSDFLDEENISKLLQEGFFSNLDKIFALPEEDIETYFSLALSLVGRINKDSVADITNEFAAVLSKDHTTNSALKLRLLVILFNLLDEASPLRHTVFVIILKFTLASGQSANFRVFPKLPSWILLWKLEQSDLIVLYELVSEVFKTSNEEQYKQYLLKYLSSLNGADSAALDAAKAHASAAITNALASDQIHFADVLMEMDAVRNLEGDSTYGLDFQLVQIFVEGAIEKYVNFSATNKARIDALGLDETFLLTKLRNLQIDELCAGRGSLDYDTLMTELKLADDTDVEMTIVEAVTRGVIDAKIDQEKRIITIRRSGNYQFHAGAESWDLLGEKLTTWRDNVNSVLSSLHSAQAPVPVADEYN